MELADFLTCSGTIADTPTATQVSKDLDLVKAVICWLAEFPGSPYNPETTVQEFVEAHSLLKVFGIFNQHRPSNLHPIVFDFKDKNNPQLRGRPKVKENKSSVTIGRLLLEQIDTIEMLANTFLLNTAYNGYDATKVNFSKAILFGSFPAIVDVAKFLIRLGTTLAGISSIAINAINFLQDRDRLALQTYLNSQSYFTGTLQSPNSSATANSVNSSTPYVPTGDPRKIATIARANALIQSLHWEISVLDEIIYSSMKKLHEIPAKTKVKTEK